MPVHTTGTMFISHYAWLPGTLNYVNTNKHSAMSILQSTSAKGTLGHKPEVQILQKKQAIFFLKSPLSVLPLQGATEL